MLFWDEKNFIPCVKFKTHNIMKRLLFVAMLAMVSAATHVTVSAQEEPILYFCEQYDSYSGEINVSDRFTTGYITVVVKSSNALNLSDCYIQYDKYNSSTRKFEYYKQFSFTLSPTSKYVYFEHSESNDMSFETPGFYRVYLLDGRQNTVTSSIVEIIPR